MVKGQVRAASARAGAAVDDVPVNQVPTATSAGAHAVPGSQLAAALGDVGPELDKALHTFADACAGWAFDLDASVAAYEETDAAAKARLDRMTWRAV